MCDPDNPDLNVGLAECLLVPRLRNHDVVEQGPKLREAVHLLKNALILYELGERSDGHGGKRSTGADQGRARYWLGRAHFQLDDYERAITNLRLAAALGYEPLLSRLRLGVAAVRAGALSDGERELAAVEEMAAEEIDGDENDGGRRVGPVGDQLSLKEIWAWARAYLVSSQIERGVQSEAVEEALEQVRQSAESLEGTARLSLLAAIDDCGGWAKLKAGNHEAAEQALRCSVEYEPTPEAYLHLALVYVDRALHAADAIERHHDGDRAKDFADVAKRMGLGREQIRPLEEAMLRLDQSRATPSNGAQPYGGAVAAPPEPHNGN